MSKALATKNVAAVLLALSLALGASFAFVAPAHAQTSTSATSVSSLQAQVQALLAQIQALQGSGSSSTTSSTSGACFTFTQNLKLGSTGGQVMWVQEFLNSHGFQVAATGAGSPGNETSHFGPATKAAVIKFQNANASTVLTPNGLTTGNGNWYASTRAAANAMCAGSTTGTTGTGTTGTTGTTTAGAISITAGTQPANSLAPFLANRVPFTTFTLTNTSGAAVTVNGIMVQRTGLAADAAFAGVELIDQNGTQYGTSHTFNSNHQTEVGTPFTLQPGQSMTYTIAGNMQTYAIANQYSGQVASIAVTGVDTTVPVSGSLPITGASQTINSSLTIGTATVQNSSYDPDTKRSESIGTTAIIFSGVRLTVGSAENEKLYSITWNQTGSVGSTDISNLKTYVNGTAYPVTVDSTGKYYTAVFPGGITVNEGNSVDAYIQGDLTGNTSAGRTVEFDIYRPSDIYLVGQTYGYGITPTSGNSGTYSAGSNSTSGFQSLSNPFYFGSTMSITAGTLSTISSAGSVGSQNIGLNVPNQPLGGFTTNFTGEPVTVQTMSFSFTVTGTTTGVTDQLQNVSLVDSNGNVVAGPVNAIGNVVTFNSSVTFPVGAMTYTLKGTVPSDWGNGATIQANTTPSNWTGAQGQISGTTVSFSGYSNFSMSTMTVQSGSLVVSAASTPASTTVAPGANNFVLANINLDASQSGENIRLSSLPIVVNYVSGSGGGSATGLAAGLTNCQLWNGTTALNTQAIGGTATNGWGVNSNTLQANFIFQNAITIPKGTVTTLSLQCNISSSLAAGYQFSAGVSPSYATTLLPTGVQSGNTVTTSGVAYDAPVLSASGTMTVGSASLAATIPSALSFAQVSGGTTGVTVGTITLQPTSDSVNLQNIGLTLNGTMASSSDVARAYIYNGATQVGSVIFSSVMASNNKYYATSTISNLNLPMNQQTTLTIKADINNIGAGQAAMSGHKIDIELANAQGVGASSGTSVNSGPAQGGATQTGVNIYRTYPTVALSSYLPSNGVSDGRLIAFAITANSSNPVGVGQLTFNFSSSTGMVISNPALYVYTDSGFSVPAGGTSNGVAGNTTYSAQLQAATSTLASPLEVPAGSTWYFLLKGTVSNTSSNSTYNVATTLLGDSANLAPYMYSVSSLTPSTHFVWSPNSTTTSLTTSNDWTNSYGVSGLPTIGITQNRTN